MGEQTPFARYELHQVLVQLRVRAGLTRPQLARFLNVSDKSIQHWEDGTSTPKPTNLQRLVNVYVERGVFTAGQEQQEAEALWAKAKWDVALDDTVLVQRDQSRKSPPSEPSMLSQTAPVQRVGSHGKSLFPFNAPLTDPQEFHGRNSTRRRVLDHIAHHMSISLVGPRRIGKTWFLQYVQLVASQELGASFSVAYLDATLPGCQTVAGFTRTVLEGLGVTQFPTQEHSLTLLHLERLVKQLRIQGQTLVLCIDEFEGLCTPSFDREFFSGLRAIAQTGMVLLTASKEDLVNLVSVHVRTSPFFNMLIPIALSPFTRKEAEAFAQAKSQTAGFTAQEQQSLLAYGQSDESSWPPARMQLVGLLLLEEKKSSDHDGPELYRPDDPSYWQQFA